MAEDDLLVTISGAAMSLLFFENMRSVGDQIGFLLGEAFEFVVKTYTDSDNQVETVKVHINVETIVTCPLPDILHDSTIHINKERLKDFVRDKSKHVVGWFRFRRNTNSLIPSLKDKLLHKQFISHFSDSNGCREDSFLICLLNASTSETRGTHKFRHVFLRRKQGMFDPIPLRIKNLGDDASKHDGSDYKPTPTRNLARAPDGFSELIKSLNLDVMKIGGLESAMAIQQAAENHLTSLIPKVCESDLEVTELERQVRELRAKVAAQRLAVGRSNVNGENCTKGPTENFLSFEEIESTRRSETNKISNDAPRGQREHISTSSAQSISSQRGPCRNTAAYIAKSVNQEKSRQIGVDVNNQQVTQEQQFLISSRNRHTSNISDITAESILPSLEDSEVSCIAGVGRGRGSGSRAHEFIPTMSKSRRPVTAVVRHPRERITSLEQDFSDASGKSPISRSLNQTTKKNLGNPRNAMDSLDI